MRTRYSVSDTIVVLLLLVAIGAAIWKTTSYYTEINQREPASLKSEPQYMINDSEKSIDGNDVSLLPPGGTDTDVDPTLLHLSDVKDQDHDHEDCRKAVNWALENGAMDEEIPEMTEQEKFDFLLENPKVEAALEYYEEYMIGEDGQEVRREQLEEDFELELEQLQAQGGPVMEIDLEN